MVPKGPGLVAPAAKGVWPACSLEGCGGEASSSVSTSGLLL
jgi:hypothetical protein